MRNRLAVEGIVPASGEQGVMIPLSKVRAHPQPAVRQRAGGSRRAVSGTTRIHVDSALGKETIESMNVPASFRLGEIAENMGGTDGCREALGRGTSS